MSKKLLIIIDMQNDFITGCLGNTETQNIVKHVVEKAKHYKTNNFPIIGTRDTHTTEYLETHEGKYLPVKHCIENTYGWQIISELNDYINDCVINKKSFGYDNWKQYLDEHVDMNDIETIELCGVCTDICVVSNALILRALFPELDITVDARCCAGVTPKRHDSAIEVMKACHITVIE